MRNYYGYVRVSTVKQGEHGVSLQEQRDAITRYCHANNFEVTEWFEERVTAAKSGRPVFGDMLKRLRQGKAEGVICHKIDRSARNLRDWANLGELLDQGIDVRFANESLDLTSRGGRLSADIQAVVAADYIRNLREETRKGFYGRLKQGYFPMKAPLGYVNNGGGVAKSICPVTGPLVAKTFELYSTGRFTLDTLLAAVLRLGLRNRRGGKLARAGLGKMLNNPFYIGLIQIRKTNETFLGKHPPLIGKPLFDRVQSILDGRAPKKIRRHDFLFRQLITCAGCGHFLIGELQKGHVYYRCQTRLCRTTCIREEPIADAISDTIRPLTFQPEEYRTLMAIAAEMRQEYLDEREKSQATAQMRIAAITARIAKLTDAFMDNLIEQPLFEERKTALQMERLALQDSLRETEAEPNSGANRVSRLLELAANAWLSYKSANDWEKRDLVKTLFSNRHVAGKNVTVELNPAFQALVERPQFEYGGR